MRKYLSNRSKENVALSRNQKIVDSMELDDKHCVDISIVSVAELIGEGGFAKVFKCQIDGQQAVCKQIHSRKLDDETSYLLKNECTIWSRLAHDNIVGFLGMTSNTENLWLLCEYMPDGSLFQKHERRRKALAAPTTEVELINQLQQVAMGMDYLHALEPPVLHRDLKSPNILLQGKRLAIADFGLARYQERAGGQMTAETGSYRWMAPEVIRHEKYDMACDVYSYAVLGWEMLTDRVPFDDIMPVEAAFAVAKHGKRPPMPESVPGSVRHLIDHCWAQDAKARPSFSVICAALAEEVEVLSKEAKQGGPSVHDSAHELAPTETKA